MQEVAVQYKLPKECVTISGSALYPCVIDLNAMRMVLDNLVSNACKYSSESPKIILNLSCVANHVRIEFKDHGIGISHKDQKTLFQKFHRIYRRDTPSVKGTGLGLYWVSEIIKTHGGKISVFSEGQGKGTAFHIELPVYQVAKRRHINRLLKITQQLQRTEE
jgi:signal transduction histidine kinase